MKRLIKRYVLKAQVDKENDEVNEGKKLQYSEAIFSCCIRNQYYSDAGGFKWKEGLFLFHMHRGSDSNGSMPISAKKMEK